MPTHSLTDLRRRQTDRALAAPLRTLSVPRQGWIAAVRQILGLRTAQLGARAGMSGAAVTQLEKSEAEGTITLKSLQKMASAMDCRLVYAFVPETSFQDLVHRRAQFVARHHVARVSHTMALEDQAVASEEQEAMVNEVARDLIQKLPRELWDEPV